MRSLFRICFEYVLLLLLSHRQLPGQLSFENSHLIVRGSQSSLQMSVFPGNQRTLQQVSFNIVCHSSYPMKSQSKLFPNEATMDGRSALCCICNGRGLYLFQDNNLVSTREKGQLVSHQNTRLAGQKSANALIKDVFSNFGVNSAQRIIQQINICISVHCSGERNSRICDCVLLLMTFITATMTL